MRILLVKTSSLGDVIHNLPVASDIRRRFPEAEINWVVEEAFAEIPRLHPAVRRVLPVAVRRWRRAPLSAQTWREIGEYRRLASADFYDAVIDTQGLLKSALLAKAAAGAKYGYGNPREPLASAFYDRCFDIPRALHAVARNRQLAAAALGYTLDALPFDYGIDAAPLKADWLPAEKYAVLLSATSRTDKEWPGKDWHAMGSALNAAGLLCVLPAGTPNERERAARLAGRLGHAIAAPSMNLADLAGLMAGARLVVGVDTGLVHLAAALRRPTLALYCASDPALTGVLSAASHLNLGNIGTPPTAEDAIRAALGLIER